jgi:hypothetical protein
MIEASGKTSLLNYMKDYWQSNDESDESFWEHEWETHGTCINTIDPKCYSDYTPGDEAVDFFQQVVSLFKTLDTYQVIIPRTQEDKLHLGLSNADTNSFYPRPSKTQASPRTPPTHTT